MRGIKKETIRRPRNRNLYLYIRSIGPSCWGTCPTETQGGEWLSRKIPLVNQFRTYCLVTKNRLIAGRKAWTLWRVTALDDWRMLLLAFSHVTCTRGLLAAGNEVPRSCRNHSLLHPQRYCHRFAHARLRLVSFWTPPAHFFFNAPFIQDTIRLRDIIDRFPAF